MSKHTTQPHMIHEGWAPRWNSHVNTYSDQPLGNWNRHKKRRVASSKRTEGRIRRSAKRAFHRLAEWSADAASAAL